MMGKEIHLGQLRNVKNSGDCSIRLPLDFDIHSAIQFNSAV